MLLRSIVAVTVEYISGSRQPLISPSRAVSMPEIRQVNHPCKLKRIGHSDNYRILHCEHVLVIRGELRKQCCNCTFNASMKQGDLLTTSAGPHGKFLDMPRKDDKPPMTPADESEHEKLVKEAERWIRAVTTDHNVTLEHSAASLKQLKFYIDGQLDQLESGL
jgi:hypothetical protein